MTRVLDGINWRPPGRGDWRFYPWDGNDQRESGHRFFSERFVFAFRLATSSGSCVYRLRVLRHGPDLVIVLLAVSSFDTAHLGAMASLGMRASRGARRRGGVLGGIVHRYLGTRFKRRALDPESSDTGCLCRRLCLSSWQYDCEAVGKKKSGPLVVGSEQREAASGCALYCILDSS